jgi:site-specific DNA-methyltransferase (adenine-specific)
MINRSLFSSASVHWATPKDLYDALDAEFHFNDDPCPLHGRGGLDREWGTRTYCNPPYGQEITKWCKKGYEESLKGKLVVMLIPSRTDTKWWHEYIMKASEIRFCKGRLKFGGSETGAPFPSAIVIFRPVLYR